MPTSRVTEKIQQDKQHIFLFKIVVLYLLIVCSCKNENPVFENILSMDIFQNMLLIQPVVQNRPLVLVINTTTFLNPFTPKTPMLVYRYES